jgi:hypothetical protein
MGAAGGRKAPEGPSSWKFVCGGGEGASPQKSPQYESLSPWQREGATPEKSSHYEGLSPGRPGARPSLSLVSRQASRLWGQQGQRA